MGRRNMSRRLQTTRLRFPRSPATTTGFQRKRRFTRQQFKWFKGIRPKNRQDEQGNERQASFAFAASIERPINRIDVPVKCEKLLAKLEKYQDNGMFKEHDELVTEKIRYYKERKAFTRVWFLKIEECTTYSYKDDWKQAWRMLTSITRSDISVEYSDVIKARAMYLLVAHERRNKEYRTSKTILYISHLITDLEECEQLLHNYDSPEDWAEFYQTFGCVRMDYMSHSALDEITRNAEREKAIHCFKKAIDFSEQDTRERVRMKRQSYVHLQLAKIQLNDYHDITKAETHLDVVQSKFGDTLPTATRMLLYKTQSDLFFHKGQYHLAIVMAMEALKLAVNHGFKTEVNTLREKIDCCLKILGTHDQMLSDPLGQMLVSNADLLAVLEKVASDKGFVISDNERSGNCMFHALSEQLNLVKGIKISHGELRRSIVQYLRKNPKLRDGTDLYNFTNGNKSWADYLTNMKQDGTWGDHIILYATANHYETNIQVISRLSNHHDLTIRPDRGDVISTNSLVLGHVQEVHYVSLRPKQGEKKGKRRKKKQKRKKKKETVKQGIPTNKELEELGNAIGENWTTLGRRLDVEEKLEEIDHAHRRLGEKGYQMLRHWKQKRGSSATYQALYSALTNKLLQRQDLAEKICCICDPSKKKRSQDESSDSQEEESIKRQKTD